MQVVERCRKWKYEVSPRQRIFCITAIYRVAGEDGSIAKVLHASAAVPTCSVGAANPRNSNARSGRKVCGGAFHDVADNLMSGNQVLAARRKFAFHNMQVGTANTAGADFQQDMARLQRRARNFIDAKRTLRNILGCGKDRGFHQDLRSVRTAMILVALSLLPVTFVAQGLLRIGKLARNN